MKELGVGWALRLTAKGVKPRIIISENGGKWSLRTESAIKTLQYDFTPGVEFDETTADGREVKVGYSIQLHDIYDHSTIV
jgi:fatty acid-binding protein 3